MTNQVARQGLAWNLMANYLTASQVAERLGVSTGRVRELIRVKRLPATKFGTSYMIAESDVKLVAVRKVGRPGWLKHSKKRAA